MNPIQLQKHDLRKNILKLKKQHLPEEKTVDSNTIFEKIEALEAFKNASTIMAYWSMNDEVYTQNFVNKWYKTKTILLPVVDGNMLRIKQYFGPESMVAGELFGILEPCGPDFESINKIELVIVPGVAFDEKGYRMGRGRAYYDKFLLQTNALKIGICFKYQLVKSVPIEEHDSKMDLVVWT